jgi:phage terminase Nu1 subunit (DNA packaging protein)
MNAKPKKPTIASIASQTGISRQSISAWVAGGLDLSDPEAIADRVAMAKGRASTREDITAARLRKLKAEADRGELLVAKERGQLIPVDVVEEAVTRICSAVKGSIMRLEADLPQMLEGLSPARMQQIIRQKIDEILTALSDDVARIGTDGDSNS